MKVLNLRDARTNLYNIVNSDINEPVFIKGKKNNAILLSEDDWRSIEETMYLSSIPELVDSIIQSKNETIEECTLWPFK